MTNTDPKERDPKARGLPASVLVHLDLDAPDLSSCVEDLYTRVRQDATLGEQQLSEIEEVLRRHADSGPEALSHSVAIIHQQMLTAGPSLQILIRFSSPLNLRDEEGQKTHFLWVLLSNQPTHPHVDAAAEFAQLMHQQPFREAALAAKSREALEDAYGSALEREIRFAAHIPDELQPSHRFLGGVLRDMRRRGAHYASDYTDGLKPKTIASTIFLFFACLSPAIAFGGLLSLQTKGSIGAVEMLISTAVCGLLYAVASAQPLTILGSTGPVVIFIGMLFPICERLALPFLPTLACVGLWTMAFLLLLTAIEACNWIRYFTRFTDDIFAALISLVFIVEALADLIHVFTDHKVSYATALLSLVLAIGTYGIAMNLSRFRRSPYLRQRLREFFADFGPAIAIFSMSAVAYLMHEVELETLAVPARVVPTMARGWFVNPFEAPPWVWLAASGPAALLALLLFLDQNITVRLVNSPENRLKKGAGYHLDLAIVGLLVGVCSLFGLPWMVAATVRSLNHLRSLATVESSPADREGNRARITSVIETRLTGLLVHLLIGISLLFLPLLKLVPMTVLFGLFLFMGVASMAGNQFFERLRLWFVDPKQYPPTYYLRAVPTPTVHRYTGVQLASLVVLWIVKASAVGILFPLFVALLVPVRMVLGRIYKQEHLALLDAEEVPEDEEFRDIGAA